LPTIEILSSVSQSRVRPRDCALLVAVPSTRREFFDDYRVGTDFVKRYTSESPSPDASWGQYEKYASLARHVIDRVKKRGVSVIERATLADLHKTLPAYPVTTLMAHWRSARFRPDDISRTSRVAEYLAERAAAPDALRASDGTQGLAADLNRLLDEGTSNAEGSKAAGGITADQYRWHERRQKIEAALPGAFRGGAAVEFAGGFCNIAEISGGIAATYAGILDLTVCQSVLLGEMVRRKCPRCLVLTSAEEVSMDFRLAAYHQAIEILARSPRPYENLVVDIRKAMLRYGTREE
jgi:hypothetical protein